MTTEQVLYKLETDPKFRASVKKALSKLDEIYAEKVLIMSLKRKVAISKKKLAGNKLHKLQRISYEGRLPLMEQRLAELLEKYPEV